MWRSIAMLRSEDLRFHHCRALEAVKFDVVTSRPRTNLTQGHRQDEPCDWSDPVHGLILRNRPCAWLKTKVGFWPLFLAVGGPDAISIETGYLNGGPSSKVLFSYAAVEGAVLLDHVAWHAVQDAVLMSDDGHPVPDIDEKQERSMFRPDLTMSDWLDRAAVEPGGVLAVVPQLDLRAASRVACHDEGARDTLLALGFQPDQVRIWTPVPSWDTTALQEAR